MRTSYSTTTTTNTKKNNSTSINREKLFAFKKQEWPETDEKLKVKLEQKELGDSGNGFTEHLRVIDGTEHPELFLMWLQEFRERVLDKENLSSIGKKIILLRVLKGEAKSTATRAATRCREGQFQKYSLQTKAGTMNEDQWKAYLSEAAREPLAKDQIEEMIYCLKLDYFGNDRAGRASYNKLKRQMRNTRVETTLGCVRKWATRIDEWQAYLPEMLWDAGERRGLKAQKFNEMELRELLDGCLHNVHHQHLINIDWDVTERNYMETITKLETLESQINAAVAIEQRLKSIEDGGSRKRQRGSSTAKGGDEKPNKNAKTKCTTCSKYHKGKCWHDKENSSDSKPNANKEWYKKENKKFRKETLNMIKHALQGRNDPPEMDTDSDSDDGGSKFTKKVRVQYKYLDTPAIFLSENRKSTGTSTSQAFFSSKAQVVSHRGQVSDFSQLVLGIDSIDPCHIQVTLLRIQWKYIVLSCKR